MRFLRESNCVDLGIGLALIAGAIMGAGAGDLNPTNPPAGTMTTLEDIGQTAGAAQSAASSADSAAQAASAAASAAEVAALDAQDPRTPISSLPYDITQSGSYYLTDNLTAPSGYGITVTAHNVTIDLMGFYLIGGGGNDPDADGIRVDTASPVENLTVRNGTVRNWGGTGLDLDQTLTCRVEGMSVSRNEDSGIRVGEAAVVIGCTSTGNTGNGIIANSGSTMIGCTAVSNSANGLFGNYSTVVNCVASSNGTNGISANTGSTVIACTASDNVQDGISGGIGSMIRDCTLRRNGDDGIQVESECVVIGNLSSLNSQQASAGAGIFANGDSNRIEGNTTASNQHGLLITGEQNLIVRNFARGNTTANFNIYGNNHAAQRLSGGADFVSTDPWANFEF